MRCGPVETPRLQAARSRRCASGLSLGRKCGCECCYQNIMRYGRCAYYANEISFIAQRWRSLGNQLDATRMPAFEGFRRHGGRGVSWDPREGQAARDNDYISTVWLHSDLYVPCSRQDSKASLRQTSTVESYAPPSSSFPGFSIIVRRSATLCECQRHHTISHIHVTSRLGFSWALALECSISYTHSLSHR